MDKLGKQVAEFKGRAESLATILELKAKLKHQDERVKELECEMVMKDGELNGDAFKIQALEARVKALLAALDFAKGAVADAIYCEDGLDGATGEGVMRIITEVQEKGTFDQEVAKTLTGHEEKMMSEIESLRAQLAEKEKLIELKNVQIDALLLSLRIKDKANLPSPATLGVEEMRPVIQKILEERYGGFKKEDALAIAQAIHTALLKKVGV